MNNLRRLIGCIACSAVLAGCATTRPATGPPAPAPWEQRLANLQQASTWQLQGRAAVALGKQGWQASLDWRQHAEVRLRSNARSTGAALNAAVGTHSDRNVVAQVHELETGLQLVIAVGSASQNM